MSSTTDILNQFPIDPLTGSIAVPVYQTATFVQSAPGEHKGFDYARSNNPTRQVFEEVVSSLENGYGASAFATGIAAIDAVLKLLETGDEVLAVEDVYGGAYRQFTKIYAKFGIRFRFIDTSNLALVAEAITPATRLIWIESPTNPLLKISDIAALAELAKDKGVRLVVDNTFAGPLHQKPLNLGADFVIHSATKYLAGHSDLVAGVVISKTKEDFEAIKFNQNAGGAILGPWDSFLALRGIETLPLRFQKQSETALQIAAYLQNHPDIESVYYPGLPTHQLHQTAKKQQGTQFGGVISFVLKNKDFEYASKVVQSFQQFHLAESLGGVKSLCCLPWKMTHASVPEQEKLKRGISPGLIRLSCGIEEAADLIQDLESTLKNVQPIKTQLKCHV